MHLLLDNSWERFKKFYSDKEAQKIEGEERYCTKLLGLLQIT